MSASGLCQICQSAEADVRCDRCGALVCTEHHDEEFGLCVECVAETGAGDPQRGPGPGEGGHPDVDRYQF